MIKMDKKNVIFASKDPYLHTIELIKIGVTYLDTNKQLTCNFLNLEMIKTNM